MWVSGNRRQSFIRLCILSVLVIFTLIYFFIPLHRQVKPSTNYNFTNQRSSHGQEKPPIAKKRPLNEQVKQQTNHNVTEERSLHGQVKPSNATQRSLHGQATQQTNYHVKNQHGQVNPSGALNVIEQRSSDSVKIANKTAIGVLCLFTVPSLQRTDLSSYQVFNNEEPLCSDSDGNITFDIDMNTARSFKFESPIKYGDINSTMQHPKPSQKPTITKESIPKKLHFIWNNGVIPTNFVGNLKRFRKLHPDWEFNFWTIGYGRKMVQKLEPKLLSTYDSYRFPVQRADVLRYVLIYHIGGAYFDLDVYPRIPLDNLTSLDDCIVGPEPFEHAALSLHNRSLLGNAAFLCKPRHAFFRHVIDALLVEHEKNLIIFSTGPVFFTKSFNSYIYTKLFNSSKTSVDELVNLLMVPHDYFELLYHKNINVSKICEHIMPQVDQYVKQCVKGSQSITYCWDFQRNIDPKSVLVFQGCLEWVMHGKDKRNLTKSIRYVDHVHAATHTSMAFLRYKGETNVTRLLPNAIIHI